MHGADRKGDVGGMKIYNFEGEGVEIEIDKENTVAVVEINVSGDGILGVLHKDGTEEWYDAGTMIDNEQIRWENRIEGYYFVPKEDW